RGAITAFAVEEIENGHGPALIRVRADVARVLGLLQVSGLVEPDDLIGSAQPLVRVGHVGGDNRRLLARELLRLRDREAGLRDVALVLVEDRNFDVAEDRRAVRGGYVRITELRRHVPLPVRLLERELPLRSVDAELRRL